MITDYIHYELGSSFEENNIDLVYLAIFYNGVRYYKSNRHHELYLPSKIMSVKTYMSFYENELLAIRYSTSNNNTNCLIEFINSFASSEDEVLFEDVLGGNSDLFCIQNGVAIHINMKANNTIDFKIAVPLNKRKNNVFV